MIGIRRVDKNRPPMFFALSMVALLVGCGEGTDALNSGSLGANAAALDVELGAALPELGAPPTQISPSISAAQLLNDNTVTVGTAQAVAAGEASLPSGASDNEATEQVAAEAPAAPAAIPAVEPNVDAVVEAPQSETVTVTSAQQAAANVETPALGAALPTEPVAQEPVALEPAPAVDAPIVAAAEPVAAPAQTAVADAQTRFTGSTSPTFSGVIQDDGSVLLDWDVDPTARGYNVYRDAEYIQTVFENTYVDEFDTFDRNYYYEIQAFTADEIYSTIATGLTVTITGTGRINPNDPLPAEGLLDNYELVFSDEFNGDSLDLSKWNTAYLWGDDLVINSELQHYVDIANDPDFGFNPFTFDGETLAINTIRTPAPLLERANGQEYLSGVITSYDAFQFTYGYVEARAKVPFGKGYWPAFWLLNAFYDADKPEIDIMEFIGDNQDTVYHTFHYYDEEGNLRSTKSEPTFPIDFTADFHTFGAEWSPGTVTFYVDGIARHTINDPKMSQEQMYIIANTAVGGWWPGDPDENTEFPGRYEIDYIRAYQRVGVQLDPPQFANPDSAVPVRGDQDFATPGHLPPFELFPEGYPEL